MRDSRGASHPRPRWVPGVPKPREETSTHHPSVCAALRSLFSPGSRRLLPRRWGQHPPLIDDLSGAGDTQTALWRQQKTCAGRGETQVQSWSKTRPESEQRLYFGSRILLVVLADGEKGQRCSHFRIKKPTACVLCTGQARDQAVHPNVGDSAASASGASGGCAAHSRRAGPTCACWPEQKALQEPSKALRKARRRPPTPRWPSRDVTVHVRNRQSHHGACLLLRSL